MYFESVARQTMVIIIADFFYACSFIMFTVAENAAFSVSVWRTFEMPSCKITFAFVLLPIFLACAGRLCLVATEFIVLAPTVCMSSLCEQNLGSFIR